MHQEPTDSEVEPPPPGTAVALRLTAAFLVAFFLVLVLAWRDNGRRQQQETTADPTAAGDNQFFSCPQPEPARPYPSLLTFHGQKLIPVDFQKYQFHADDVFRVGRDDTGVYLLYRAPIRRQDPAETLSGTIYFLKTSPTEYLKVRLGPEPHAS